MTDTTDRLIAAWVAWDRAPGAPGTAAARHAAMTAASLPFLATQIAVARNRARGMSIPDAVMTAINEQERDVDDEDQKCSRCEGEGQVRRRDSIFADIAGGSDYPVCRDCGGTGIAR